MSIFIQTTGIKRIKDATRKMQILGTVYQMLTIVHLLYTNRSRRLPQHLANLESRFNVESCLRDHSLIEKNEHTNEFIS